MAIRKMLKYNSILDDFDRTNWNSVMEIDNDV